MQQSTTPPLRSVWLGAGLAWVMCVVAVALLLLGRDQDGYAEHLPLRLVLVAAAASGSLVLVGAHALCRSPLLCGACTPRLSILRSAAQS
jgi:4-amino-4-deoxy-L-arabinose transferase-like glycosyltransferase